MKELITLCANVREAPAIIEVMRDSNYWLFEMLVNDDRHNSVILTFEYHK